MATISANEGTGNTFYDQSECDKFKGAFSEVAGHDEEENSLIDDIYGSKSKVKYEEFIELVCERTKWAFSAPEIRKRVHNASKVPIKHIK